MSVSSSREQPFDQGKARAAPENLMSAVEMAYISIGSNIDRQRNVRFALSQLRERHPSLVHSSVYETQAVGFDGDPFYNLVVAFETGLSVHDVREWLRTIEAQCGRDREQPRFSPRTLDMDLLLFGDLVTDENGLQLPRDEITLNAYVLKPLAEIAGTRCHPTLGKTFDELWSALQVADETLKTVEFCTS